jgi:SAM-dependent methyltransferase
MPRDVTWPGAERCAVGDIEFQTLPEDILDSDRKGGFSMKGADFLLLKVRPLVQRYIDLVQELEPRSIFELGIFEGGSTAFLYELAQPQRMVAVDQQEPKNPALREHIARHGLSDRLRMHADVDQADRGRLVALVQDAFGDEPLDLVIDDCSHLYEPTRASFNEIFPRLRPGGVYMIEDWPWAHTAVGSEHPEGMWPDETPLSRLVFELVLALPSLPGLITGIDVDRYVVTVRRGPAEVDRAGFDIAAASNPRGRDMLAA